MPPFKTTRSKTRFYLSKPLCCCIFIVPPFHFKWIGKFVWHQVVRLKIFKSFKLNSLTITESFSFALTFVILPFKIRTSYSKFGVVLKISPKLQNSVKTEIVQNFQIRLKLDESNLPQMLVKVKSDQKGLKSEIYFQ